MLLLLLVVVQVLLVEMMVLLLLLLLMMIVDWRGQALLLVLPESLMGVVVLVRLAVGGVRIVRLCCHQLRILA